MESIKLKTPLSDNVIAGLRTGDWATISGIVYTARDAAHRRMSEEVEKGLPLPFDPRGQVVYYVGPTPAPPGRVIGSAGPTTAGRMDPFTNLLIERGLKGMIGKGGRSKTVREGIQKHGCIYFGAVEGTAALLSEHIVKAEVVAYEDLGTESIRRLEVNDFPVLVVNDIFGGDLYEEGKKRYRRRLNSE